MKWSTSGNDTQYEINKQDESQQYDMKMNRIKAIAYSEENKSNKGFHLILLQHVAQHKMFELTISLNHEWYEYE